MVLLVGQNLIWGKVNAFPVWGLFYSAMFWQDKINTFDRYELIYQKVYFFKYRKVQKGFLFMWASYFSWSINILLVKYLTVHPSFLPHQNIAIYGNYTFDYKHQLCHTVVRLGRSFKSLIVCQVTCTNMHSQLSIQSMLMLGGVEVPFGKTRNYKNYIILCILICFNC